MGTPKEPVVGVLAEVWASTVDACGPLEPAAWERPTDCPGWSVKDLLSHLIGLERVLLGEPMPPTPAPAGWPPHVHNDFGAANEVLVEARRPLPGPAVLAEFAEVTARRLRQLDEMDTGRFDEVGPSPVGDVPYRDFLWIRVFDSWVHEQDLRHAVGRPGGRGGGGEAETLRRVAAAMGFVVGKKAAAPDGAVVVWHVTGPLPRRVVVTVDGGKGRVEQGPPVPGPDGPGATTVALSAEAFWRLGCGRVGADEEVAAGRVQVTGDRALGHRVLDQMNFMF